MIYWVVQYTIISLTLIILVHYIYTFLIDTLTVPKLRDFVNKVVTPVQSAEFTFDNNINKRIQGIESALNWQVTNQIEWGMTATVLLNNPINESYKRFATTYINYTHDKFTFNVNAIIRDKLRGTTATNQIFLTSSYSLFSASLIYQISHSSRLSLKANNVFDKHYMTFDPRVPTGEIPGQGQQIKLSLHYLYD